MKERLKLKNTPLYIVLTLIFAGTYFLRGINFPIISAHITNFAVTGVLLCVSIYPDLQKGKLTKRSLYSALIFWCLVNIILELFVRVGTIKVSFVSFVKFNTPDPVDAIYGIVGIAIFAFVTLKYCSAPTSKLK